MASGGGESGKDPIIRRILREIKLQELEDVFERQQVTAELIFRGQIKDSDLEQLGVTTVGARALLRDACRRACETTARAAVNATFGFGPSRQQSTSIAHAPIEDDIREARGLVHSLTSTGSVTRQRRGNPLPGTSRNRYFGKYGLPFQSKRKLSATPQPRSYSKRVVILDFAGEDVPETQSLTEDMMVVDGSIRYPGTYDEIDIRQKILDLLMMKKDGFHIFDTATVFDFDFVRVSNKRIRKPDGDAPFDVLGINTLYPTGAIYVRLTKDFTCEQDSDHDENKKTVLKVTCSDSSTSQGSVITVPPVVIVDDSPGNMTQNQATTFAWSREPRKKKGKISQLESDEIVARELQEELDNEWLSESSVSSMPLQQRAEKSKLPDNLADNWSKEVLIVEKPPKYKDCATLVKDLETQVDTTAQFFIVVRRCSSIQRQVSIWQREAKKNCPNKTVKVHFAGENGIDTGAMAKEFFSVAVKEIGKTFFPYGSPVNSMLNVHDGTFATCGEIVATSIAQGGPPPCFLEKCVYKMLVEPYVDMKSLCPAIHMTTHEQELLKSIAKDPLSYKDIILEHDYTGKIDKEHIEAITGTIMVSLINKRLMFLSQFKKGLSLYGLFTVIERNSSLCEELFVSGGTEVDANYLVSCLVPNYSAEGTSKRNVEETLIDHFQDLLISLEDEKTTGYAEELAWEEGTDGADLPEGSGDRRNAVYPDLTPAGVLGWLTGQKHVPLNGEKLEITVNFDHDCMTRNESHKICFPIVGACGRVVTLPVAHMKKSDEFKHVFILAFCNGQSFANV